MHPHRREAARGRLTKVKGGSFYRVGRDAKRANGGPVRSFTTAPARMKGTKNLSITAEREMEHIGETKGAEKQSAIKSG